MMLSVIMLSMLMLLLFGTTIWSVATTRIGFWSWNWSMRHWGKKWLIDFVVGKIQLFSFDQSNSTSAIAVKMDGSMLEDAGVDFLFWIGLALLHYLLWNFPPRMKICKVSFSWGYSVSLNLYVAHSNAASLKPLVHCWNVASLSLFCRYYFGRYSFELAQLVSLPYSRGRSTCYSNR